MKMIDFFCGTKSIGNVFKEAGHEVLTIDYDYQHNPDICDNVLNLSAKDILNFYGWDSVDFIHMSPDCTTYSIAAVGHHRIDGIYPKSKEAEEADRVRIHILKLIEELKPTYFTIENPRGMMRNMPEMKALAKKYNFATTAYCQYGDTRQKPTDWWGKFPPALHFKPVCKRGSSCHEAAPRGSRKGTQGLNGSVDRSRIPRKLCESIRIACEKAIEGCKK
jgi:hypothetical protein